jgi:hypothetical protein
MSVGAEEDEVVQVGVDVEQLASFRWRIEVLSIPAIRNARIMRVVNYLCAMVLPLVVFIVVIESQVRTMAEPLDYITALGKMRTEFFQLGVGATGSCSRQLTFRWSTPLAGRKLRLSSLGSTCRLVRW